MEVEVEGPADLAGQDMVDQVKLHVRSVLREPLKHMHGAARENIITQVSSVAVQACFAFLAAHEGYVKPNREAEDLPEVDVHADEKGEDEVWDDRLKERALQALEQEKGDAEKGGRNFGDPRTMYDWVGPRPDWYTGPLRSEGDPPP